MSLKVDYLIVTAIDEERDAVKKNFRMRSSKPDIQDNILFYSKDLKLRGKKGPAAKIALCKPYDKGPTAMARDLPKMLKITHPRYLILVGIFGGFSARDVEPLDLIIPKFIRSLTRGKEILGKYELTEEPISPPSRKLITYAEAAKTAWESTQKKKGNGSHLKIPHVVFDKELISSPVNLSDSNSPTLKNLLERYKNAGGVDMEAGSVGSESSSQNIEYLVIKSASDCPDGEESPQEVRNRNRIAASEVASSFTYRTVNLLAKEEGVKTDSGSLSTTSIADLVSAKTGHDYYKTRSIIDVFLSSIWEETKKNSKINIANFGFFELIDQKPRKARDPQTKKIIEIPSKKKFVFRASNKIRYK